MKEWLPSEYGSVLQFKDLMAQQWRGRRLDGVLKQDLVDDNGLCRSSLAEWSGSG